MRYYLDTEFDGHDGALITLALIREDNESLYVKTGAEIHGWWVIRNVVPVIHAPGAPIPEGVHSYGVGARVCEFLLDDDKPIFIADAVQDVRRLSLAMSTDRYGHYRPNPFKRITFEVHNIDDLYPTELPGAVQHNAWWDAMVLKHRLENGGAVDIGT